MRLFICIMPLLALVTILVTNLYPYGGDAELTPDPAADAYSRRLFAKARANWKLISAQQASSTPFHTAQPVADSEAGF